MIGILEGTGVREQVFAEYAVETVHWKAKGGSIVGLGREGNCLGCSVSRARGTLGVDRWGAVNNTRGRVCTLGYFAGMKQDASLLGNLSKWG